MSFTRRRAMSAGAFVLLGVFAACASSREEAKAFEPVVGQRGKDVIWVPTPDSVVQRMLDMAQVTPKDYVVDLGSGDGKIAIAAAKRGARARGIEFNPDMVALSKRNAQAEKVNVDFVQGDIFEANFSDADVVTLFLLPSLNVKLRPILLDMKPGTRITSHEFDMGDWKPDRTEQVASRAAHLWIVPAKVAGEWTVRISGEPEMKIRLEQQYQELTGHALKGDNRVQLQEPAIQGEHLHFKVPDDAGTATLFEGTADHNGRMSGRVTFGNGARTSFTAERS